MASPRFRRVAMVAAVNFREAVGRQGLWREAAAGGEPQRQRYAGQSGRQAAAGKGLSRAGVAAGQLRAPV